MNKLKIVLCTFVLLFSSALAGCSDNTTPVQEDSSLKNDALKAYLEILKAAPAIDAWHEELENAAFGYDQNKEMFGDHFEQFAVVDINQDEIPELIALSVVNFRWTPVSVYTYVDGKAVLLKDPLDMGAHGTFEQMSTANGAYITYICRDNHIHSVWSGITPVGEVEENYAYVLEDGKLSVVDCTTEDITYFTAIAKENTLENVEAMIQ